MKVAYADPPYIGKAKKHYGMPEVDHAELIDMLCRDYDCWALSCNSTTLRQLLPLCPSDVRIGAWVKPFATFKKGVNPVYGWEGLLFWHPRKRGLEERAVRDWVSANITFKKGVVGAKPVIFCRWIFELLGLLYDDEFFDLYSGTGIVTREWEKWRNEKQPLLLL